MRMERTYQTGRQRGRHFVVERPANRGCQNGQPRRRIPVYFIFEQRQIYAIGQRIGLQKRKNVDGKDAI